MIHVHGVARAAASIGADGYGEMPRGALLQDFLFEPVEALECPKLLYVQRDYLPADMR